MSRGCTLALALLAVSAVAGQGAIETTLVEVYCASEHVPDGMKPGARVDLMIVSGKTVTRTGKVNFNLNSVAKNMELVSINKEEKPKTPEQAVKVELRVTKAQAVAIEKIKSQFVTVIETTTDGKKKTEKRPVPLRIVPTSK